MILAIDPGCTESAYVLMDDERHLQSFEKLPNNEMLLAVYELSMEFDAHLVIEMMQGYGMAVGAEVFETVFWTGKFCEAASHFGSHYTRVYRKDVKLTLCGTHRAKDAIIRQRLIDMYGPGKEKAVGTKKLPGPLYGVSKDVWSALAVGVTFFEMRDRIANDAANVR